MIKKIQYKNDKILKDLSLDFTKPDGTPYSTIVFLIHFQPFYLLVLLNHLIQSVIQIKINIILH